MHQERSRAELLLLARLVKAVTHQAGPFQFASDPHDRNSLTCYYYGRQFAINYWGSKPDMIDVALHRTARSAAAFFHPPNIEAFMGVNSLLLRDYV
jgi:hypothetical protein